MTYLIAAIAVLVVFFMASWFKLPCCSKKCKKKWVCPATNVAKIVGEEVTNAEPWEKDDQYEEREIKVKPKRIKKPKKELIKVKTISGHTYGVAINKKQIESTEITTKKCGKCKKSKPSLAFHVCRGNKTDGLQWRCKDCYRVNNKLRHRKKVALKNKKSLWEDTSA